MRVMKTLIGIHMGTAYLYLGSIWPKRNSVLHHLWILVLLHPPRIKGDAPLPHVDHILVMEVCKGLVELSVLTSLLRSCRPYPLLHVMILCDFIIGPYTKRILAVSPHLDHSFILNGECICESEPLVTTRVRPVVKKVFWCSTVNHGTKGAAQGSRIQEACSQAQPSNRVVALESVCQYIRISR